jgi:hypothetical protein
MTSLKITFFLALVTLFASALFPTGVPDFEPTDEWKQVLPDQAIPPGLHVRMDLSGGGKWAKNLAKEEESSGSGSSNGIMAAPVENSLVFVPSPPEEGEVAAAAEDAVNVADGAFSDKARVLLSLPVPEPVLAEAVRKRLPAAEVEAIAARVWAARQTELAEAWSHTKTEGAQTQGALNALDSSISAGDDSTLAEALEDLEFQVASVHNAEDFAALGGLSRVGKLMSHASPAVAARAAWVLGTAIKGQPALIDAALDIGAAKGVAALLSVSLSRPDHPDLRGAAKAVYAAGALARAHARGQREWLKEGGTLSLANALRAATAASPSTDPAAAALATKTLNLVADLCAPLVVMPISLTGTGADGAEATLRVRIARQTSVGQDSLEANETRRILDEAWTQAASRGGDAVPFAVETPQEREPESPPWKETLAQEEGMRSDLCEAVTAARLSLLGGGIDELGKGENDALDSLCPEARVG